MGETGLLGDAEHRALATELARSAVKHVAPEELVLFDEIAVDYWSDPVVSLEPDRRGEAVGFGMDAALVTPMLIAMTTPVIEYLAAQMYGAVGKRAGPKLTAALRRLLGLLRPRPDNLPGDITETVQVGSARAEQAPATADAAGPDVEPLTSEQLERVRGIAEETAVALGVPAERARVLANAVVGSVVQ
jgi:hypothetical protein